MNPKIGIFVGSLRAQSLSRKLANALVRLAASDLRMDIVEIGHLPHCNADHEDDPPQAVVEFKRRIESLDGVIFVTPEYNRGVPGVLKNAIDVASRPYGSNSWEGKPAGVISLSPGSMGGFGANHQLRQSFVFLDMPVLQQPEAYLGDAEALFDDHGDIAAAPTVEFLRGYLVAFKAWVQRHSGAAR